MEIKRVDGTAMTVEASVFDCRYNPALVHQAMVAFQAGARAGTKAQKNRSQVAGGGHKPWRQKGTGRARAGTTRGPLWVGGGRAFASQTRCFHQKLNKKMHRGALRSVLSELNRSNRLIVIDELTIEAPKTKLLLTKLKSLSLNSVLIVLAEEDDYLFKASGNIPWVDVLMVHELDIVSMMRFSTVLMTQQAISQIQEKLR